jgi:hypothetical protein
VLNLHVGYKSVWVKNILLKNLRFAHDLQSDEAEEELHRVDEEEDEEEQRRVEGDGSHIVETVAAEEYVMGVPKTDEERKANSEGKESAQGGGEFLVGFGDLKRDDEEGEREAEDDVAEGIDAVHMIAAETEAVFICPEFFHNAGLSKSIQKINSWSDLGKLSQGAAEQVFEWVAEAGFLAGGWLPKGLRRDGLRFPAFPR